MHKRIDAVVGRLDVIGRPVALGITLVIAIQFNVYPARAAKLCIVAEWNRLTYDIQDKKIADKWTKSDIHGKTLIQGLKLDSQSNMYVSTARWGGQAIPATLSKLVEKNGIRV